MPDDPKITQRRNRTYERSYTRFHGKINRNKSSSAFQALGKNAKPLKIDERFVISDSLDMHAVHVRFAPEMLL